MSGVLYVTVMLLLLYFIRTGVNGDKSLIFAGGSYKVRFPCEEMVCYYIWYFSVGGIRDYISIVTNGEIQMFESRVDDSECTLKIKDLTTEDIGHHHCQQRPAVFPSYNSPLTPGLNIMAGTVSLQCVLFIYIEKKHCYTEIQQEISLMWVDEAGAQIQEDSQYQIKQQSPCDVTLIVNHQSPVNKKFRCQVTVDGHTQTSVELLVRGSAFRGGGRGFIVEPIPDHKGHNLGTVVAPVGVAFCVVLTALIAAFAVNRRRTTNTQLRNESSMTTNNVVNEDDVIYADISLPATGSDRLQVQECTESTEYAIVRYH